VREAGGRGSLVPQCYSELKQLKKVQPLPNAGQGDKQKHIHEIKLEKGKESDNQIKQEK
jgi:hypothetical protein